MSTNIRIITPSRLSSRANPSLEPLMTRLRFPLAPIHPLPEGPAHPAFPKTLLNYHLLTEEELDSIAHYYHQNPRSPTLWTHSYPTTMDWDAGFLVHVGETRGMEARVRIKRRKFGRFIGLRGCDTPVEEVEEKDRFVRRREESNLKTDDIAFWGRRGWRW